MKKTIILLIVVNNYVFSQTKTDYEITLAFNFEKKEILTYEFPSSEKSKTKVFKFVKIEEIINNTTLEINEKGELNKILRGNTRNPCCSLTLYFNPERDKMRKVKGVNVIRYFDFKDTSFKSFLKILENAKKVYIIDSSQKMLDGYYNAYEVSFKP
jgi:hypothetical protein